MKKQDAFFRDLVADPDTDIGLDPGWVHLYPYQATGSPGQATRFELRVRNLRRRAIELEAMLVLPKGWRSSPARLRLSAPAGQNASAAVTVTVPAGWHGPLSRLAIAADVVADGKYLGQIAEAVVDIRERQA
jgi:hypothetical protein